MLGVAQEGPEQGTHFSVPEKATSSDMVLLGLLLKSPITPSPPRWIWGSPKRQTGPCLPSYSLLVYQLILI